MVVGSGPAGSIAALVLARGGARVALVDKASFPRDKACGDLVGPRGVQVLDELGIAVPGLEVGDMEVVGPTGGRVVLRARAGETYPGHGVAVTRRVLDDRLRSAALESGAHGLVGRAGDPLVTADGSLDGFRVARADGVPVDVTADVVIGADGALSRVASAARLVDEPRVLWGFAVRGYLPSPPALPQIYFWEPSRWSGYPGYGWLFPGPGDTANIGLGVGFRGDRRAGTRATRDLPSFAASIRAPAPELGRTLGGWLKLGMVGTTPARGRVLLVGDAAGLVNSLQGEGISQAIASGRAAAHAVLTRGCDAAAGAYREWLARTYGGFAASTVPVTAAMVRHPRAVAALGRLLTAPPVGRALAGGWSIYWNDLLDGALPGSGRRVAALADLVARAASLASRDARAVRAAVGASPRSPGGTSAPEAVRAPPRWRRPAAAGPPRSGPRRSG